MKEENRREWMGAGEKERMNEFQTVLIPRELYCGNSEKSLGGDRNDNSAHCEGRQERS